MTSSKSIKRSFFWNKVFKLGIPLLFAFFVIILLLNSSNDIFSGDFSKVIQKNFIGIGAMVFFGSVITTTFFCSLAIVAYDMEERKKEQEEEQII